MFWLDRTNLHFFCLSETLDGNEYQFMLTVTIVLYIGLYVIVLSFFLVRLQPQQ